MSLLYPFLLLGQSLSAIRYQLLPVDRAIGFFQNQCGYSFQATLDEGVDIEKCHRGGEACLEAELAPMDLHL